MTQSQTQANKQDQQAGDETSLIGILIILAKYRKRILAVPAVVALIAAAVSLALPSVYSATTRLLPPQPGQSSASALLSQLGGMAGMAAGAVGLKNPNDLYVGMLKSRTVADNLIEKFKLKAAYGTESLEKARAQLAKNTAISAGKDSLITIQVEDRDQKRVALLANAYVAELTLLTKQIAVTEAGQRRMFYERELIQAKDNLAKAEAALKGSLDTRGVISVDAESRAMLETVGRLRAQVSAKEIQLSSMRAFVTQNNNEYKRVEEELSSLRAELSKLENGRGEEERPVGAPKQSGFENIQLLRDVKYYQMLYELLGKQYEVARLDEAKDPSMIQVLDRAVEPERKAKPHRALIVAFSTLVAFFLAILSAFVSELGGSLLKTEAGMAQWRELKGVLRTK